jgi:hypothetical protein
MTQAVNAHSNEVTLIQIKLAHAEDLTKLANENAQKSEQKLRQANDQMVSFWFFW